MRRELAVPLLVAAASTVGVLPASWATEITTTTIEVTTTTTEATTTTTTTEPTTTTEATTTTAPPGGGTSGLTLTFPATSNLSSGTSVNATSLSGQLGEVTVEDARGALLSATSWTATVSATAFMTGSGQPNETIPSANVAYWSGLATAGTGVAIATAGQATAIDAVPLDTPQTAFSLAGNTGTSTVTWNPMIVVTIPPGMAEGTYRGTITHSIG